MRNHVRLGSTLLALTFGLGLGGDARASFVVNMTQVGGDVVAKGNGSINFTALTFMDTSTSLTTINPQNGAIVIGGQGNYNFISGDFYVGTINGPSSLGSGVYSPAQVASGDQVGASSSLDIIVPAHYTSGASLTSSSTWTGATFASLGVTTGTYTWTWGSGATADSFTLNVGGPAAVPEPASLAMLGLGSFAVLGCARRRRTKPADVADRA